MDTEQDSIDAAEQDTGLEIEAGHQDTAPADDGQIAPGDGSVEATAQAPSPNGEQPQPGTGSLTSPQQTEPNWQERYGHLRSATQQWQNDMTRRLNEQQSELSRLRAYEAQQRQAAEQARLPRWSRQHPEHTKFQSLRNKVQIVQQQLNNLPQDLTPEARDAAKAAILGNISEEEQAQWIEYQQQKAEFQDRFFEDPQGAIHDMVRGIAASVFQDAQQQSQAHATVAQDFEDPAVKPVIEAHREEMAQALKDGVPYNYAIHMARMYGELEQLRSQVGQAGRAQIQAQEQMRLTQSRAAATREPRPAAGDPYRLARAEATKQGIPLDSPAFITLLERFQQKG